MHHSRFRHLLSTFLYVIVLFFILWGNNLLINFSFRTVILPFFSWFYDLKWYFKLVIVFGFGTLAGMIIFGVFMWITAIVGVVLSFIFLYNKSTFYISVVMVLANIIFSLIDIWKYIEWDFWRVFIWLLIFYFIFQMNWAFVFKDRKVLDQQAGIEPY
jgi:hypothetical protein